MGYVVDYNGLSFVEQSVKSKCEEWASVLGKACSNIETLVNTDSIQGTLADGINTYLKEVHFSTILVPLISALGLLRTNVCLYLDGYRDQVDNKYNAHISENELISVKRHFSSIINSVDYLEEKLTREVQPVSDLIYLAVPSSTMLIDSLEAVRNHCIKLDTKITQFESTRAASDFAKIDEIITNVQSLLDSQMGNKRVKVRDYQAGMVSAMTDVVALMESVQSIQDYQEAVADELQEALERDQEMLQDMQEERQWAKWVAMGVCVIGSVTLLVVSAGTATPLVCAGVGAAVGLTSAAANGFADNYIATGSLVEGMNWAEFGKDCLIGTVTGAVSGAGLKIAHGSSVVKPLERAMMKTATGIVENSSKGIVNFAFDVGTAVVADGATFDTILTAASDSTESMMKDVLVGMASDAAGGFVGGVFDTQAGDKGFLQTIGEETIGNLAEKEAQIGSAVTFDAFTGFTSGDDGLEILSTIDFDMKEGAQAFVEDEFSSALSSGFDTAIDNKFKGDKTPTEKMWSSTLKGANKTVTGTAGTFMGGATGQLFDDGRIDVEELWNEDLGGGAEIAKNFSEGLVGSAIDENFSEQKFRNNLGVHDYDHDGKVEVVTFKNFSGYSVLKEDYDAAVESAGGVGYRGRRAQDILGVPRNVSFSEDNIEVHKYKTSSLKKADYTGKGKTNAIKLEHK